jgi:hypothetical protein
VHTDTHIYFFLPSTSLSSFRKPFAHLLT